MSFSFSYLSFSLKLREREREREREWYIKFGYKEKWPQSLLIFFFLWWSSCGECFFFYGLIDFMLFLTLAWRTWVPRVRDIFLSSSTRNTGFGSSARYEPCPTTKLFLLSISADEKESPLPFWGLSQSFGFSLLPLGQAIFFRATRCHPSPILFPSGHPVQTSVFSILARVCYFGNDLHSFMF